MIWGNLLITRDFKNIYIAESATEATTTESCETRHQLLNPQSKSLLYRDTIKLHFDRFVHAGVTTGALYFFFDNKEDLFKNVLIPVTEGAIQILGDYKDHLLVSAKEILKTPPL